MEPPWSYNHPLRRSKTTYCVYRVTHSVLSGCDMSGRMGPACFEWQSKIWHLRSHGAHRMYGMQDAV